MDRSAAPAQGRRSQVGPGTLGGLHRGEGLLGHADCQLGALQHAARAEELLGGQLRGDFRARAGRQLQSILVSAITDQSIELGEVISRMRRNSVIQVSANMFSSETVAPLRSASN